VNKLIEKINGYVRRLSVRAKMIALLIVVSYLSFLLVSTMVVIGSRSVINDEVTANLELTTKGVLGSINRLLFDRFSDIQSMISDSTITDPKTLDSKKTEVLNNFLVKLGWYDNLHYASLDGTILASTQNSAIHQSLTAFDWFKRTRQSDATYVSDLITSPFTNKGTVIFGNTVIDRNNKPIGVLFGEFSWQVVQDLLKETGDNTDIFLISKTGQVIAQKTKSLNFDVTQLANSRQHNYAKEYFVHEIVSKGYLGFNGNKWTIISQIPKSIAYEPISKFMILMFFTIILISGFVFIVGQLASSRFVKPIIRLTDGVAKMKGGNLSTIIKVTTNDEIGYLTDGVNQMSASLLDITTNLMEEKGKYRSILESTPEGIILADNDNIITTVNMSFLKLFAEKHDEVLGNSLSNVFKFIKDPANELANARQFKKIQQMLDNHNSKNTTHLELTLTSPNYKILKVYSTSVTTKDKQVLGRLWSFEDITKEKESEQIKDDFIKIASHKLRTPITVINWTTQLLADSLLGKISKKQGEALGQISNSVDRLNYLVNILMNAAEISKKQLILNMKKFPLGQLIAKTCKDMNKIVSKDVDWGVEIVDFEQINKIEVSADEEKVHQVLSMLLENTLHYAKYNFKQLVKIAAEIKDNKVIISISDVGIGIPPKEQPKIFTKFFRGQEAFTKDPDGSGLSLYLAKIIIQSHKEKIWFESTPNVGTTFYFTLNLKA